MFSLLTKTTIPDWVNTIDLPGLEEWEEEVAGARTAIERMQTKLKDSEDRLQDVTRWRALVYETGRNFQDLCDEAFKELGGGARRSDVSDEFTVVLDDVERLVEAKGVGKSAAKSHVAQLVLDAELRDGDGLDQLALMVKTWRICRWRKEGPTNSHGSPVTSKGLLSERTSFS